MDIFLEKHAQPVPETWLIFNWVLLISLQQ